MKKGPFKMKGHTLPGIKQSPISKKKSSGVASMVVRSGKKIGQVLTSKTKNVKTKLESLIY